eukprot:306636-Hanusia_phi.AAC.1
MALELAPGADPPPVVQYRCPFLLPLPHLSSSPPPLSPIFLSSPSLTYLPLLFLPHLSSYPLPSSFLYTRVLQLLSPSSSLVSCGCGLVTAYSVRYCIVDDNKQHPPICEGGSKNGRILNLAGPADTYPAVMEIRDIWKSQSSLSSIFLVYSEEIRPKLTPCPVLRLLRCDLQRQTEVRARGQGLEENLE